MIKEFLIRILINAKFGRFGKMLKLDIDSKNKIILAEVLLKGEVEAVKIKVGRYEVQTESRKGFLLSNIETSRSWMTEIVAVFGPEIFIPLEKANLLKVFL